MYRYEEHVEIAVGYFRLIKNVVVVVVAVELTPQFFDSFFSIHSMTIRCLFCQYTCNAAWIFNVPEEQCLWRHGRTCGAAVFTSDYLFER